MASPVSKLDLAVVVGRCQPCHLGHIQVMRSALEAANSVLILVGSSNLGRSTRNPFTAEERIDILLNVIQDTFAEDVDRFFIKKLNDFPYDNIKWLAQVQAKVDEWRRVALPDLRIGIVAHDRDESQEHARRFPHWTTITPRCDILHMNATQLRRDYFLYGEGIRNSEIATWLPLASLQFLDRFARTPEFKDLKAEHAFEDQYKKDWGPGPFQTVDAVVIQSGHVLAVERKKRPGQGKFAMPGGHLEIKETLDHGCIRELWEETRLFEVEGIEGISNFNNMRDKVWPHFRCQQTFDAVNRSNRARVITTAFLFKLPDSALFPTVVGSDDAARAFWLPLSQVKPDLFFEDHAFIIEKMIGYLN